MVRSAPRIVLRTRPAERFASDALRVDQGAKTATVVLPGRAALPGDKSSGPQSYQFKFDAVLHDAPQDAVFEECAADVVQGALEGFNGTILCYGQTGAGKTYTMTGDRSCYQRRGLIPRTISALLAALRDDPGLASWRLRVTYLEIYNEQIYDLLDITTQPHEISLYEDGRGRLTVGGLRAAEVRSEAEALALFFEGEANRVIGEHQLNRESSRSHCVFTLALDAVRGGGGGSSGLGSSSSGGAGGGEERCVSASVSLVDLAGSERVSKTRSEGLVLREAGHINKSLHILEQVVLAASERGREHVPYRSCRLTHVLRDSIGGNCRTVLVANVWGDAAQLEETLSTCRFAARMARITCEVTRNVASSGGGARVKQLEREVAELLDELAMHDLWSGRNDGGAASGGGADGGGEPGQQPGTSSGAPAAAAAAARVRYLPYSPGQRAELRGVVEQYLHSGGSAGQGREAGAGWEEAAEEAAAVTRLRVDSMRRLREVLRTCKELYREALLGSSSGNSRQLSAGSAGLTAAPVAPAAAGPAAGLRPAAAGVAVKGAAAVAYIGDEEGPSSGAGLAPDDARPGGPPPAAAPSRGGSAGALGVAAVQQAGGAGSGWAAEGVPAGEAAWGAAGGGTSSSGAVAPHPGLDPVPGAAAAAPAESRAAALERYRAGPGAAKAALLNANHAKARAAKKAARELALRLNGLKRDIDAARGRAEELRGERLARGEVEAQVATAEELDTLAVLRDLKGAYRDARAEHELARSEAEYAAGLVEACARELAAGFDAWWAAQGGDQGDAGGVGAAAAPGGGEWWGQSRGASAASGASSALLGGLPAVPSLRASSTGGGGILQQVAGGSSSSGQPHAGRLVPPAAVVQRRSGPAGCIPGAASGGGVPLASIVVAAAADAEAAGDGAAAAYYNAQQAAWQHGGGSGGGGAAAAGGQRPGSFKKHRGQQHGTFSLTHRSAITDSVLR